MHIVTIIGARPQFIKAAMLSREVLSSSSNKIKETIVHTGQHYDTNLSALFFEELDIPKPQFNLSVGSGSHGQQTGRMLEAIENVLLKLKPNFVLVYGDTNSTLSGSLAAAKLHIPVIHVEAGLRSFNNSMPEEINRVITDRLASILFTPSDTATKNLVNEGIPPASIIQCGDIMYDALLFFGKVAESKSKILQRLSLTSGNYILATIHRAENTDNGNKLRNIFMFLNELAKKMHKVIVPLHPRTADRLGKCLSEFDKYLTFTEPVGYLDMIRLEKYAAFIITDSGGAQKEAFFYQKPCVILRDETEWVEIVQAKYGTLVSPNNPPKEMYKATEEFLLSIKPKKHFLYGQGNSSKLIINTLLKYNENLDS